MIGVITFGPIEKRSNGYFIRTSFLVESIRKVEPVLLFEIVDQSSIPSVSGEGVVRIPFPSGQGADPMGNPLSFNPFGEVKKQAFELIGLLKNIQKMRSCRAIFVEGALLPFGLMLAKINSKKVILDTHCMNTTLAEGLKNRNSLGYIIRKVAWSALERFAISASDEVVFVSNEERLFCEKEYSMDPGKGVVIPNLVEVKPLRSSPAEVDALRETLGIGDKIVLAFIGDFGSIQNYDTARFIIDELAPDVARSREDVVFVIIGKGKERFQAKTNNVILTGFVEDLDPYISMIDVFIAPMRMGSGTKTKTLLFLEYGKEVLSTPIGVEGIDIGGRTNVKVAHIDQFSEVVRALKKPSVTVKVDPPITPGRSPRLDMEEKVRMLLDESG